MRSLWAVACAASVSCLLLTLAGGCSGTKSQVKEFNRMEVGEGPREALRQMIEMQKEPGGQRVEAHPVLVSPGEGTDNPVFYSSDFSSGNLSMSRATGAMHDVQPAVPPLGNPPLLVQTDVQSAPSPPDAPVAPANVAPRYSPAPAPVRKAPPPAAASGEPPAPAPPPVTPPPVTASVESPAPPPVAPSPAAASVEPPAPAPPPVAPPPNVASVQPPLSVGKEPPSDPPVSHQMTLKKEAALQTASRKTPSSISTPPPSTQEKKKTVVTDLTGGPNYRIGPEDVLHIDVWGNKELTTDAIVRPDGNISLPLIQDVQAEGMTSGELSDRIREKLTDFLKDPTVSVTVKQVNASKFFIIGYVARPGTYPLRGDITVLQAISLGGGFTPFASPRKLRLVRNAEGKQDVREINYYDIIEKAGEGNYLLKSGDTLVVP